MTDVAADRDGVLLLAMAVVKPGGNARLLNEDNSAAEGWWALEEAAQSGQPFFVELKDTLAAFDLDTDELVASGEELEGWATSEGLPVVVVSSGRDGHRHLYISCQDRLAVEDQALAFGIPKSAHRRAIRPPLAPHRQGLPTGLVRPQTVEAALEALGPAVQGEPVRKNMPEWLINLINDGDTTNRYGGRAHMALAIASGLRAVGYDFDTYRRVMSNRDNLGGAKYHALEDGEGTEKPDAFLARTWEKASNQLSPNEILDELAAARAAVLAAKWPGRTGNTDRKVMLALSELGTGSGTTMFTFGSRRIALVAQIEDKTVRKSLGRLVDGGWLERLPASKLGDADSYRFGQKMDKMTAHIPSPPRDKCGSYDQIDPDRVSLHPLFRNGSGLGQGTGRTWLILRGLSGPSTAKEIAEAGAADRRTVSRHLNLLESHGLAAKDGRYWTAVGDVRRLDELAISLGAVQRSEIQADRYERGRLAFRFIRGLPIGGEVELTADEAAIEEEEFRRWFDEQLLLEQLGLPHHPV